MRLHEDYKLYDCKNVPFEILQGKVIRSIFMGEDVLQFECGDNESFLLVHDQDCCEDVYIESVVGDLKNLLNTPIVMAEMVTNSDLPPIDNDDSYTWTFYKLSTIKGYVTIRWYGASNGYYSEGVDLFQLYPKT